MGRRPLGASGSLSRRRVAPQGIPQLVRAEPQDDPPARSGGGTGDHHHHRIAGAYLCPLYIRKRVARESSQDGQRAARKCRGGAGDGLPPEIGLVRVLPDGGRDHSELRILVQRLNCRYRPAFSTQPSQFVIEQFGAIGIG